VACEWLTVEEVAAQLKVTKHSVHRWIRAGKLDHSLTPGGERRVCKADLVQPGRKGPPTISEAVPGQRGMPTLDRRTTKP
jgi:excisionase family DNA binding protein